MEEGVVVTFLDGEIEIGEDHELWPVAAAGVYDIRPLLARHIRNGFLETLSHLAPVDLDPEEAFKLYQKRNKQKLRTYVAELRSGFVMATATLYIEQKFIHKGGKVAHLEDFVVHKDYQGQGVGTFMLDMMEKVARDEGCYKIILNCKEGVVDFYTHRGYTKREDQMRKDL